MLSIDLTLDVNLRIMQTVRFFTPKLDPLYSNSQVDPSTVIPLPKSCQNISLSGRLVSVYVLLKAPWEKYPNCVTRINKTKAFGFVSISMFYTKQSAMIKQLVKLLNFTDEKHHLQFTIYFAGSVLRV